MTDKFGSYVQRLMTTIIDKEQEEFVKDLAWNELKKINADIKEFLIKNQKDYEEEQIKTKKILLQEEKNGKDK